MSEHNYGRIIGRDGLNGVLMDPLRADRVLRVQLADGRIIQVPGSMLRGHSPDAYEVPLGPRDVESSSEDSSSVSPPEVISVLAEELHVDKKAVATGAIRVHRRVHEHEELVDIPLRKERFDVQRVVIDREVEGPLPVRREGDTTIIPIVEEVVVIGKKFVLKEEVRVSRRVQEEHHRERVKTQLQESFIERVEPNGAIGPIEVATIPESGHLSERELVRNLLYNARSQTGED